MVGSDENEKNKFIKQASKDWETILLSRANELIKGGRFICLNFGIDEKVLDFIVDDNPLKQGLFTPISHIPVFSSDALYDLKPDYVIVLAWNFAEQIMSNHSKYSKEIGSFILPMPEPRIVS